MFSKDFYWGAATASYQIEGAWNEDGKGLSIWDTFSHTPGKVMNNDTGDVACDHYHRFREDVQLMKKLGLKAYRFSISWPRVLPEGTGKVNEKGIAFYSRLVDELLAAGITPYCTLYHWDLPQVLMDKGGWCNPDSALWFEEYTRVVAERLGDRLKMYFTFNEVSVFIKGIVNGIHAPGLMMQPYYHVRAFHNILRAHGKSVKVLRELVSDCKVGIAPAIYPMIPQEEKDIEACRNYLFSVQKNANGKPVDALATFFNVPSMLLDPVVFGKYPEDGLEIIRPFLPEGWEADMAEIAQPIDFIAHNTYQGRYAEDDGKGGINVLPLKVGYPRTAIDWPVTPECMYWVPKFIWDRYKMPIYITENGLSCHDWVALDGKVHDYNRIDYLQRHLLQLEKAMADGADVRGYFQWSLMDNYEWARGYFDRFGLIYVDYPTGTRTIKDSGYWYREVIASNGALLHQHE